MPGGPLRRTGPFDFNHPDQHNYMKKRSIIALVLGLVASAYAGAATEYAPLLRAKKFIEAEKLANATLARDPANADAMLAKVNAILGSSGVLRVDEAVKVGEQCVAARPQAAACHLALGNALGTKAANASMMSAIGYAGTVRDAFKKAIELEPRNIQARFSLLEYYNAAPGIVGGGKDKAQDLAKQTAAVSAPASQLMLAQIDIADGQLAKAESVLLAVQPGNDDVVADRQRDLLTALGHNYLQNKKYADSERIFNLVQKRYPDSEAGLYGLGRLQQEQGRYREAIAAFEQALAVTELSSTHYRIAHAALSMGDKARAASEFDKALVAHTALPVKFRSDAQAQLKALR